MNEPLLTPEQLAARWSVSKHTLAVWRARGRGPNFVRLGRSQNALVRYRLGDVERFEMDFSVEGRTEDHRL